MYQLQHPSPVPLPIATAPGAPALTAPPGYVSAPHSSLVYGSVQPQFFMPQHGAGAAVHSPVYMHLPPGYGAAPAPAPALPPGYQYLTQPQPPPSFGQPPPYPGRK